jgi:hypothetical protein
MNVVRRVVVASVTLGRVCLIVLTYNINHPLLEIIFYNVKLSLTFLGHFTSQLIAFVEFYSMPLAATFKDFFVLRVMATDVIPLFSQY